MKLDEYQEWAATFSNGDLHGMDRLILAALGVSGEAGEFTDLIKKVAFHEHALDRDEAIKELGDVLWYVAYGARALDASLSEVAAANIAKLQARYPAGFSAEASRNRT